MTHEAGGAADGAEFDALHRLCARYGVATSYEDAFGAWHAMSPEALAALLNGAGFTAAGSSFVASEAAAEAARWARALPPAQVVAEGVETFGVAVLLPASVSHFKWRLVDESGAWHEGAIETSALQVNAQVDTGGLVRRLYHLPIALALPTGYHRLSIVGSPGEMLVICAPARCHRPQVLARGGRVWGFALQLYSLRSRRNWGIGDFRDLENFVVQAARQGADVVGLNPLHALFPHDTAQRSPYSPSSRAYLHVLYIDVEAVPDLRDCEPAQRRLRSPEFQARLEALRAAPLIDHAGVAAAKYEVLELLYRRFSQRAPDDPEVEALARFRSQGGEALRAHAVFEALQSHLHATDPAAWGWPAWPEAYRDPGGMAVAAFVAEHGERIGYFEYLQWQASRQLTAVSARCTDLGMAIGLYLDLAVSVDRGGSDAWRHRPCFAFGVQVGAPPDAFNPNGQDWGLPPLRPDRLRDAQYDIFIESLRANMRAAGAIRIDHVMGLMRLFWIPARGTPRDGSYVDYPGEELFAILALESLRQRCLVIGEDLGTVPATLRDAMRKRDVQSYRLLYFEREPDGSFRRPSGYPGEAVVAVSTHDLPTLAGWWSAHDLRLRLALGLIDDAALFERQMQERARDRDRLLEAVRQHVGLSTGSLAAAANGVLDAEAVAAVHGFLATAPSGLMLVQLEDALGEIDQANLPGTTFEHPNWQRKYRFDIEDLWTLPLVKRLVMAMAGSRPAETR